MQSLWNIVTSYLATLQMLQQATIHFGSVKKKIFLCTNSSLSNWGPHTQQWDLQKNTQNFIKLGCSFISNYPTVCTYNIARDPYFYIQLMMQFSTWHIGTKQTLQHPPYIGIGKEHIEFRFTNSRETEIDIEKLSLWRIKYTWLYGLGKHTKSQLFMPGIFHQSWDVCINAWM
jgi:hypothetical protein